MALASVQQRLNLARFFKGDAPRPGPYLLTRRNLYILPSGQGLFFAVTLIVMLIGAINYGNSLGYLLTFLLGATGLVAMLHTYRNLLHLHVHVATIPPVFAGNRATIPIVLSNSNAQTRFNLAVGFPGQRQQHVDVSPHSQTRVNIQRPASRRGYQPIGRFTLSSRFPLGLFRAWSHVVLDDALLVYPAPAEQGQLPISSFYIASEMGEQGTGGDDFVGLRRFRSGDSLKHVHWKAVAREQGMQTKHFGGDRSEQLWLDWRMLEGQGAEARLSQLCRWVIEAERQGLEYGLWLPDQVIEPACGPAHYHQCLKALALFGSQ